MSAAAAVDLTIAAMACGAVLLAYLSDRAAAKRRRDRYKR